MEKLKQIDQRTRTLMMMHNTLHRGDKIDKGGRELVSKRG